jgi:hypothetical protein
MRRTGDRILGAEEVATLLGVTTGRLKALRRDQRQRFPAPARRRPLGWTEWDVARWGRMFVREIVEFHGLDCRKASAAKVIGGHLQARGEYNGYPYYDRFEATAESTSVVIEEEMTRQASREQGRERRKAEAADERAKLGIHVNRNDLRVFWPASDSRFLGRLKRIAADLMQPCTYRRSRYQSRLGFELPLLCLQAVLSDDLGRPATRLDALVALLRQTFYLNMWCGKGRRRRAGSDAGRYARKDRCLQSAVAIARRIRGLSWGWGTDPAAEFHDAVLYFDLPAGQVSFHVMDTYGARRHKGEWSGVANELFPGDASPPEWYVKGLQASRTQRERIRGMHARRARQRHVRTRT